MEIKKRSPIIHSLAKQHSRGNCHIPELSSSDLNPPFTPLNKEFSEHAYPSKIAQIAHGRGQGFRQVGVCFQNLKVFGYGTPTDFQKDVGNIWLALPRIAYRLFSSTAANTRIDILQGFDGLIRPGEMCIVLGPPGSGCSTFLKTIAGDTNGIYVSEGSYLNYQGISSEEMHTAHRGDTIYTAESDVHFPMLTVGETLTFAAHARCSKDIPDDITRSQ